MFPNLITIEPNGPADVRGTVEAIRDFRAFRFPTVADLLTATASPLSASHSLRASRTRKHIRGVLGVLLMGGAVAGFIFYGSTWLLWIVLAWLGWAAFSAREIKSLPFVKAYKNADEHLKRELNTFVQRSGMAEVFKVRSDLVDAIAAYEGHDAVLARKLAELKSNRESRQRQVYLDRFSVRQANISGIGPAKTATLISFGIETAADVNYNAVLRVPGFGDVMTGKLMAWRRVHESRFRYDPRPNAQDVADEMALRAHFAAEKVKLESTIRNGLVTLRNAKARLDGLPARARGDRALADAIAARAQAEQDLRELGVAIPASVVAFAVTPPRTAPQPPRAPRLTTTSGTPTCPRCGLSMLRRSGRYGQFWGCSRYPGCNGTRRI
jgi:hypothetical protein